MNNYDIKFAEKIEQIYNLKELDDSISCKDIETAFNLWEYYVNPIKYYAKYDGIHVDNWNKFEELFHEKYPNWVVGQVLGEEERTKLFLQVIKDVFDYDYFKQRLEYHKTHDDKECMREWLYKLDTNQLKEFLPEVLGHGFIFLTQNTTTSFCKYFNEACIKECGLDPELKVVCDEYTGYHINNLAKIFDCLERTKILEIFCGCVDDEDKGTISYLAYNMCFGGYEAIYWVLIEWSCN